VHGMRRGDEAEKRELLRLLLVWRCEVSHLRNRIPSAEAMRAQGHGFGFELSQHLNLAALSPWARFFCAPLGGV
jgi:hypothetical protein